MRNIVITILLGTLGFIVVALTHDRRLIFFSDRPAPIQALSEADREAAVETVRTFITIAGHFEGTGGDPRFLERVPAAAEVTDELIRMQDYLRRNGRREEARLMKLEPLDVTSRGPDHVRVDTKEYWIVRTYWLHREGESDPVRSSIVTNQYELERTPDGWEIQGFKLIDRPGAAL